MMMFGRKFISIVKLLTAFYDQKNYKMTMSYENLKTFLHALVADIFQEAEQ